MMSGEIILSQTRIENCIFTFRGVQVMIDRDLAEMYQVETKRLNEQVKRNIERFPEAFRFQLSEEETEELVTNCDRFGFLNSKNSRSHFATLNNRGYNIKYLPFAFTEQGIAMLSAVLRSDVAIKVSIQIMSAFVGMRKLIANNQLIVNRLDIIERKQLENDHKFEKIFNALETQASIPTQGVFFDGQVFDAYELASRIIRSARQNIVLIDNYIDETALTHLSKKKKGVNVLILTKNISKQLQLDLKKANEQYGSFAVKAFTQSHDRFLIIDSKEVYHLGASLKDLGKKWFAFSKMDKNSVNFVMKQIKNTAEI